MTHFSLQYFMMQGDALHSGYLVFKNILFSLINQRLSDRYFDAFVLSFSKKRFMLMYAGNIVLLFKKNKQNNFEVLYGREKSM